MPLFYGCISRGHIILVDKALGHDDYQSTAKELLFDLPADTARKTSFNRDESVYHTLTDNGLVYLCAADKDAGRRMPYLFLEEVKQEFSVMTSLLQRAMNAGAFEFNREFRRVLTDIMEKHNSGKGDHLTALQNQVGEVTGIMKQNVEKVLERGEKLDDLVDKTEDLQASATTFRVTSQKITRKMFWKNKKMIIIIVVIVLIVLTLIILFATGVI